MMRTLYAGVSGLKNHQVRMDVIGNNISNVNTIGFKSERVMFHDLISQTISGAAAPRDNVGGVNPQAVGLGMNIASIDKLMTQGSLQTTGKGTDVAITGEGFFVVADGDKKFYTRAGSFDVDKNGQLVNPADGFKVQGWNAQSDGSGSKFVNNTGTPQDIIIPLYSKEPAKETTYVVYKSNLNARAENMPADASEEQRYKMIANVPPDQRRGHLTNIMVYDDQGKEHNLKVFMWKSDMNKWTASVAVSDSEQLTVDVVGSQQNTAVPNNKKFELNFSPDGKITSVSDGVDVLNSGALNVNISFKYPGTPEAKNIQLRLGNAGTVEGVTQFASEFTTKAREQDGYTMGYMESFAIDASGKVTGTFSNGMKHELAQIAMANFTNPAGLEKAGSNYYTVSNNSGDPIVGESGVGGLGSLHSGVLEMSNVDLADQFTDMIVTQRGFQANSRSITTADQMIQELLGLKR
ncbi:MAG: flagellar hook protein FlgE [Spirochaetia bacterium]|nr:flagellar hook protein FlgE [Spirochaetia bacterium]